MQRILMTLFFISALPLLICAQSDVSPVEVFGGYSYLRTASDYDENSHGWNTAAAVNVSRNLAFKADFAGHYSSEKVGNAKATSNQHSFMFGPQINLRANERANPFLHALFGLAHSNSTVTIGATKAAFSDTGFAMALGGGVDVKLNNAVSWRVFQADYMLVRYRDPFLTPVKKRNVDNVRISTGLVFH